MDKALRCLGPLRKFLLGECHRQIAFPAKPEPLLDVIGQASPNRFDPDFLQTSESKLAYAQFVFDPGMGKLRDLGTATVELPGLLGLHFGFKGGHCRRILLAHHRGGEKFLDNIGLGMGTAGNRFQKPDKCIRSGLRADVSL